MWLTSNSFISKQSDLFDIQCMRQQQSQYVTDPVTHGQGTHFRARPLAPFRVLFVRHKWRTGALLISSWQNSLLEIAVIEGPKSIRNSTGKCQPSIISLHRNVDCHLWLRYHKNHIIPVNDQHVSAEILVGEDVTFCVISRAPTRSDMNSYSIAWLGDVYNEAEGLKRVTRWFLRRTLERMISWSLQWTMNRTIRGEYPAL